MWKLWLNQRYWGILRSTNYAIICIKLYKLRVLIGTTQTKTARILYVVVSTLRFCLNFMTFDDYLPCQWKISGPRREGCCKPFLRHTALNERRFYHPLLVLNNGIHLTLSYPTHGQVLGPMLQNYIDSLRRFELIQKYCGETLELHTLTPSSVYIRLTREFNLLAE